LNVAPTSVNAIAVVFQSNDMRRHAREFVVDTTRLRR
jgi:hypothetical protein